MQRTLLIPTIATLLVAMTVKGAVPLFNFNKDRVRLSIAVQDERAAELIAKADADYVKGRKKSAIKHYETIFKKYYGSSYSPEALFQTAKIRLEQRKYNKAFSAYNAIIRAYPNYERFNHVLSEQFAIATALLEKRTSRYFGFLPYYNYDHAIAYFETIVQNAPYSDYAPLSLMHVANTHRKLGNSASAIDALDRLIDSYPRSMLAPEAYLEIAESFTSLVAGPEYDQGAARAAIRNYEDFLILFPESPKVGEGEHGLASMEDEYARSKLKMGEFYYKKRSNYVAAQIFLNEAITVAPRSPSAQKAETYLAKIDEILPLEKRPGKRGRRTAVASLDGRKRSLLQRFAIWQRRRTPSIVAREDEARQALVQSPENIDMTEDAPGAETVDADPTRITQIISYRGPARSRGASADFEPDSLAISGSEGGLPKAKISVSLDTTGDASLQERAPERTRRGIGRLVAFGGRKNRAPEPVAADEEPEWPSITSPINEPPPAEEGLAISVARALAELEPAATEFTPDDPTESTEKE